MNPFIILHHYPCQNKKKLKKKKKKRLNMSMSLNSYITHPTGAGPGGLLPHMDGPWDWALNQSACEISRDNIIYHSYYQTKKVTVIV